MKLMEFLMPIVWGLASNISAVGKQSNECKRTNFEQLRSEYSGQGEYSGPRCLDSSAPVVS
jgi:hypothetical protein